MLGLTKVTRYDVASDTTHYVGSASVANCAPADAVWRIFRITIDANGGLVIEYANGNANFENIWDNRASLSYYP